MNWEKKLKELVKYKKWDSAVELMEKIIGRYPDDSWVYVQAIYLLHNILLEEDYPEEKQDDLALLLKEYFNLSKCKFSNDPEYLFFIGKILHIAEWYFGLKDNKLAFEYQKKAMEKEPDNLLYEWAYRFSCSGDAVEGYLAHQLIENNDEKIQWLKSKGFPGEYILGHLNKSNERYIKDTIV